MDSCACAEIAVTVAAATSKLVLKIEIMAVVIGAAKNAPDNNPTYN